MKKIKSEKVRLVETILAGKKNDALQAVSLIRKYKSTDFIVFLERNDGLFGYNNCEGLFTREEIERDFEHPILFVKTKALKTKEDE